MTRPLTPPTVPPMIGPISPVPLPPVEDGDAVRVEVDVPKLAGNRPPEFAVPQEVPNSVRTIVFVTGTTVVIVTLAVVTLVPVDVVTPVNVLGSQKPLPPPPTGPQFDGPVVKVTTEVVVETACVTFVCVDVVVCSWVVNVGTVVQDDAIFLQTKKYVQPTSTATSAGVGSRAKDEIV